jgi:outer membrane receptor for ferrienterochelin and colicin
MLDARSLGFVPIRQPIELLDRAAPAEVTLTMTSTKAYLDTVRVTTTRLYTRDSNGFEKRRRSTGSGYFFDREALERRRAAFTSDILRLVPGVRVVPYRGDHVILMRSLGIDYCQPDVFVDGVALIDSRNRSDGNGTQMLDWWTDPETIDAMEVYPRGVSTPPQFNYSRGNCGSIVIWTRPPRPARERR